MSKLRYIEIGINSVITLTGLKSYMHITTNNRDTELQEVLNQAVMRVQEYSDVALLPCTIELEEEGDVIKLYQHPVSSITSVKDAESGDDVTYISNYKKTAIEQTDAEIVIVTYTTQPTSAETGRLLNYVYEMASAMWDGNTEEQNKVYQRIPINYR